MGEYIDRAATLYLPSMRKQNGEQREPPNLQAALSAQINCKLTLRELMKAQPEVWEGITEDMVAQAILNKGKIE